MTFYDDHPFDFVEAGAERPSFPGFFVGFIDGLASGTRVLDLGCGSGRNLAELSSKRRAAGLDRSLRSAMRALRFAPTLCGDAARIGCRSAVVDAVVLDGVAHHTPEAESCVREAARVLRPGGRLYIAVYKNAGYYPFAYRKIGAAFRWLAARRWGQWFLGWSAIPLYGALHRWRRGPRSREAIRSLFADYFLTPIASFHSREEVEGWGNGAGLKIEGYDPYPSGNCHLFVFRKAEG